MKIRGGDCSFFGGVNGGVVTMITSGCTGGKLPVSMNVLAS